MVMGEAIGTTDVAIIGAGPGGYTAAIRLAELGKKVTLIDRESVGGVCLHHGCIPTKALIHAAETYHNIAKAKEMGITYEGMKIDFSKTQEWKNNIVKKLDDGIRALLKHHKVNLIQANAFFEESNKLALRPVNEDDHMDINALEFKKCIIAVGSREREIPNVPIDKKHIVTSTEVIELDQLPNSLLVIGGGYIGIEVAQLMAKLGVHVTVVEALPSILSLMDPEFSDVVKKELESMEAEIYTSAKVQKAVVQGDKVKTTVEMGKETKEFTTDKVLVAIGRVPHTEELHLDNTKVELDEKGFIKADETMQTTDSRIFAIGDVIGGVMLAHKASFEAKVAAEVIAGKKAAFENQLPYAIFSDPEISGVGLTEKEARKQGIKYNAKTFSLANVGKAHILGGTNGFFKILFDDDKNILGVQIAGPRAADLIGEAVLAMEMGATIEDLALIIHPHPSIIETYSEAADAALDQPINGL